MSFRRRLACLLLGLCLMQTAAAQAINEPMGPLWLNRDTQPTMDLDGDGLFDAVEYVTPASQCILRFRFGDGRVMGYLLGDSPTLELVKIDAADLTSNNSRELILMAYDATDQGYVFHVVQMRENELKSLLVPDSKTDADFAFEATLVRGHALELKNGNEGFYLVHTLDKKFHDSLFREDGSVKESRITVTPYQTFAVVPYAAGYALELKQTVCYGADNVLLGHIVSSLVWRGGEAYLVGQRFDPA